MSPRTRVYLFSYVFYLKFKYSFICLKKKKEKNHYLYEQLDKSSFMQQKMCAPLR